MIDSFKGDYGFLSNFFPCDVVYEGIKYPSSEHAYQASKTLDRNLRVECSKLPSPGKAKRFGRKLDVRSDWEHIKYRVMSDVCYAKFTQNEFLKNMLLETYGEVLIEGNHWHDNFWGDCCCQDCPKGLNNLGIILMDLRTELKV